MDCLSFNDGDRCLAYSRSADAPRPQCSLGAREQLNAATAFLDGSPVYGSTGETLDRLRTFDGGLLKTSAGDVLPVIGDASFDDECAGRADAADAADVNATICYRSGDARVNTSPALVALHSLFVRQHNRLAEQLFDINPTWDDETLFQEARRLVVAQLQHVTYREYLPAVLGESLAENLRLTPQVLGSYKGYDMDAQPATLQAAATAALSFAVAMLPSNNRYERHTAAGERTFESSGHSDQIEQVLYGLMNTMSRRVGLDSIPAARVTDQSRTSNTLDQLATLVMRGRDHGLPGYTVWRQLCQFDAVANFSDLGDVMSPVNMAALSAAYASVHDVDLFVGGMAENPLKGAVVGPTFACILAHQFTLTRKSDRFWYENDVPPSSFTKGNSVN